MAAVFVALVTSSDHQADPGLTAAIGAAIGLSYCGIGLFAWWRRPHNRFGALLTGVGFAWMLTGLTEANDAWVYTLGVYIGSLYLAVIGHTLLALPTGRLESTRARLLVALAYLNVFLVQIPFLLLGGDLSDEAHAPSNAWALIDSPDSAQVFSSVFELVGVALTVW